MGMRLEQKKEDFGNALASVQNEAQKAFGDSRVILECFVKQPRHIEFQVLGDQLGNIVHMFERDCSVQRRHQKIVEESPSLFLDNNIRKKMADAAVTAAKTVKYTGAGTVEFIMGEESRFYFMEMNTRLQVEHPVTEMITGLDLVEWQLRVAVGEKLHLTQSKISQSGHAIEARIYAENPAAGFLPSTGKLHRLAFPAARQSKQATVRVTDRLSSSSVRIDTGVKEGDLISIDYDPLMAKMIVHADTRKNAIKAMRYALAQTAVLGVETNLGFLQSIFLDGNFEKSQQDTLFIDSRLDFLLVQENSKQHLSSKPSQQYTSLAQAENQAWNQ
jgi:3-methylcrotonyl-CoA carboxylase alpha subunit